MANIKLSAFATDIKGKVGGTVFSKNGGGAYVKNKSNGQRGALTASSNAKARFGNVSSAWKKLSADQQKLWQDATPLYPTTDKFGDSRLLSGRSLFLQLNTNLVNAGQNIISVPAPPRDLQIPDFVNIITPDFFQLKCSKGISNFTSNPNENIFIFGLDAQCPALNTDNDFFMNVQLNADRKRFLIVPVNTDKELFCFTNGVDTDIKLSIRKLSGLDFKIKFTIAKGAATGEFLSNDTFAFDGLFYSFGFNWKNNQFDACTFFVNGREIDMDLVTPFTGGYVDEQLTFNLAGVSPSYGIAGTFCDFRVYLGEMPAEYADLIAKGYYLESEYLAIDFSKIQGDLIFNYENTYGNSNLIAVISDTLSSFVTKFDSYQSPFVTLEVPEGTTENQVLKITCSKSQSLGNTAKSQKQLAIRNSLWFGQTSINLTGSIKNKLGLLLGYAALEFQVWSVDQITGQQTKLAVQTTPRKQRFKAGSELTEKVN